MADDEMKEQLKMLQDQLGGMEIQRNGALNDSVTLRAQVLAAGRKIQELEAKVAELSAGLPAPAVANGRDALAVN